MYRSTRGITKVNASQAIINGIAEDGGLYVIDEFPELNLEKLLNLTYRQLAIKILSDYLNDFTSEEIENIIFKAYKDKFDIKDVVDLKKTENCFFLELFHGPTLAFKDIALSILPYLIQSSKKKLNINNKTIILTATSGDTGSASLSAFQNFKNINMIVFYPNNGISFIQEKQMLKYSNNNLVVAINGNFDDIQNLVKNVFANQRLINNPKIDLTSANSINIGRLIPQIVYYIYSYLDLVRKREITIGDKVNYVVPTGNFGNMLALYMAKRMGLPVNKLICASNQNNIITDFFNSGLYNKERPFYKTISPSMDILISSNLERLIFYICNDYKVVNDLMYLLKTENKFQINETIKLNLVDFEAFYATEDETLKTIYDVYNNENYLIDPHTAVGYASFIKYQKQTDDKTKTIITATAHPYKFADSILKGLNMKSINVQSNLKVLEDYTKIPIPSQIESLIKFQKEKTVWELKDASVKLQERLNYL